MSEIDPYEPQFGADPQPEVGYGRQGNALTQWALARYLVGRSIGESLGASLLLFAVVLAGVAAGLWWGLDSHGWAVLVAIIAVIVLFLRWVLMALLSRLTATRQYAPIERRLGQLVAQTRGDVLGELRRLGLPGRLWTLPLLAVRLLRRASRAETFARLKGFDLDRVVPASRVDELHMLIKAVGPR